MLNHDGRRELLFKVSINFSETNKSLCIKSYFAPREGREIFNFTFVDVPIKFSQNGTEIHCI